MLRPLRQSLNQPLGRSATEKRGVRQHRIDDEFSRAVEFFYLEADTVRAVEHILRRDLPADNVELLVSIRFEQPQFVAEDGAEQEITILDPRRSHALEFQLNRGSRGARCKDKVVFQGSVRAVENEVDSIVDFLQPHAAVVRNSRNPARSVGA